MCYINSDLLIMKRVIPVFALVLVCMTQTMAQSENQYQFDYMEMELQEIESPFVQEHFLGTDIANKMQLLRENYTYKALNSMTQREENFVEKQPIFRSVVKLNKYLKKELKSGSLTMEKAQEIMDKVLLIALNIRYQETTELESELWKIKKPEEIAQLYNERIAISI